MDALFLGAGLHGLGPPDLRPGPPPFTTTVAAKPLHSISVDKCLGVSRFSFNYPFKSLLFGGGPPKQSPTPKGVALDDKGVVLVDDDVADGGLVDTDETQGQNGNWVLKILHVRSLWSSSRHVDVNNGGNVGGDDQGQNGNFTSSGNDDGGDNEGECGDGCSVSDDDDDEQGEGQNGKLEFSREMFTKMLKKVPLREAKLYAQLSYLGTLAYSIPSIKPGNLLKRYGLKYITSSIEKREQIALAEQKAQLELAESQQTLPGEENEEKSQVEECECECGEQKSDQTRLSAAAAIEIVASAASFLHTRTKAILPLGSSSKHEQVDHVDCGFNDRHLNINSEMASLVATTDSVTAVVAAKEEVKQAVADDLNSVSSSPCEWFICDDDKTATRYFVIQGSETLASWQANLLFEPIRFEEVDVFVHRGIYEAAKGMYQQMLPEIHAYMKTHGSRAKFRFTGHSLGGSLSLFINLMLLMRGEVPYSSLLPVITFGSPCVMCGGDNLLHKLGLPKNHVQSMVMHRDIVPRAFSCNYPMAAAQLLKAVNANFRNHPCLNNQKLLYSPMGEMLILQPDAKYSPQHDLLPSGSGLYLLTTEAYDAVEAERMVRSAKRAFLNMPHPLEILSDRSSYGNGGSIQRDHDMESYLKCLRGVIRQELSRIRKAERERRRKIWWPLVAPRVMVGTTTHVGPNRFSFSGMVRNGRESVKRFSRLVASQHMHLLVVLLFPAKMLLIGAYSVMSPR